MPEQTTKSAPKKSESTEEQKPKDLSAEKGKLKEEMDSLIDEIDEVLEENCEQFVKDYVQRGGE